MNRLLDVGPSYSAEHDVHTYPFQESNPLIDMTVFNDGWQIPKTIAAAAEAEFEGGENVELKSSENLRPIKSLVARAYGRPLTFRQALELDGLLLSYCGLGNPLDPIIEKTIVILQLTNSKVERLLREWEGIERRRMANNDQARKAA